METKTLQEELKQLEAQRDLETDPFKKDEISKKISLLKSKILRHYKEKNQK